MGSFRPSVHSLRAYARCAAPPATAPATQADAPATAEARANIRVERQIAAFFETLKQGRTEQTVNGLMGPSPLWNRPGTKEQMNAQIDAARLYGAPLSTECPAVTPMGTLMMRE